MKEREIEELLEHLALPPPPEKLRERVLNHARSARFQGVMFLRFTWYRALEAAAMLVMLAGAAGRAY